MLPSSPAQYDLELTLEEIYSGCTKQARAASGAFP